MIDKQDYFSGLANVHRRSELRVRSSISAVCTYAFLLPAGASSAAAGAAAHKLTAYNCGGGRRRRKG